MRIVVLDDYQNVARTFGPFDRLGAEVTVRSEHVGDVDQLITALRGVDVVVAMRERTPFGAAQFSRLPDLKLLVTTGMVNASIDLEAAAAHGVTVCGTEGAPGPSKATAELTWALILAVLRHVPEENRALRAGQWQTTVGTGVAGSTLGLAGLGRLGSQVARVGRAFDMDVIAWSENLTAARASEVGVRAVSKEELLTNADVLSVHLRLSDRTAGLFGAAELALMKPTAVLINTSRGPIVDEKALVAALHAGALGGAGLDVYDTEPLPPHHPLLAAPRTVLLPHLGYVTAQTYAHWYPQLVENIEAWSAGTPIRVMS
ncbi:D-2-hydroxyacid dehydrogenase family protein [Cryptosporangium sp. NPDC048952]|uniref:D-2-hydroxyacid dehydrogenase family protein n=1 Tax=Cryptosporangium sp. NPDC048952 TaxID=3363961 RepID=UPI00371966EF